MSWSLKSALQVIGCRTVRVPVWDMACNGTQVYWEGHLWKTGGVGVDQQL